MPADPSHRLDDFLPTEAEDSIGELDALLRLLEEIDN